MAFIQIKIEEYNKLHDEIINLQHEIGRVRRERDNYSDDVKELTESIETIKKMPFFARLFRFKNNIEYILSDE